MAKKARRKQPQSKKWSRSNVINYILGGLVALSMILSSVVVFGGATPQPAPLPSPTAVPTAAAPTAVPALTATPGQ